MKSAKKFSVIALALLLVILPAFSSKVHGLESQGGGVGPKIKGLQLGAQMSLDGLVKSLTDLGKLPFIIDVNNDRNSTSMNTIAILFNGYGSELRNFTILSAVRECAELRKRSWENLTDLLNAIDAVGVEDTNIYFGTIKKYPENIVTFDETRRVTSFRLYRSDFPNYPRRADEFLSVFTSEYKIPFDGRLRGNIWRYRDESKGWQVTCHIALSEIIIIFTLI